jgi:zinc transporter ZupT
MFKTMNVVLDGMLGFTGGVMVAASFGVYWLQP